MTSDNPRKDGPGIRANVFLGNGLPLFQCETDVVEVRTEEECDMVVARFERDQQSLGFDTENVAYFGRHAPEGTTINKSALGQFAGSICALMRFHLWAHCYDSFKRLMANPNIEKVGNAVGTDVTKLKARFPDLVCVGIVELSSLVKAAFPDLPNGKISTMVSHVLKLHLDKRVDHRLWEALHYTKRQLAYAANDADAAKRLALAVYLLREGATAAPAAPAATPIEGALDEDEQHETAVDHDTGARVACTRETVVVDSDDDGDAASDDELEIPGMATDEPSDAAAAVDADSADATSALSQSPSSRVGECGIVRFKAMITDYHNSGRTDRLELPSSLTDDERKVLHRHCDHAFWSLSPIARPGDCPYHDNHAVEADPNSASAHWRSCNRRACCSGFPRQHSPWLCL